MAWIETLATGVTLQLWVTLGEEPMDWITPNRAGLGLEVPHALALEPILTCSELPRLLRVHGIAATRILKAKQAPNLRVTARHVDTSDLWGITSWGSRDGLYEPRDAWTLCADRHHADTYHPRAMAA